MFLPDLPKWHKTNRYSNRPLHGLAQNEPKNIRFFSYPLAQFKPKSVAQTTPKSVAQNEPE